MPDPPVPPPAAPAAGRPRSGRRGRPPRLDHDAIADAALDVGFAELTMTTVARRLATTHSALYRHVRDRQTLVLAAVDRLVERAPWPDLTGRWRHDLAARAWLIWNLLDGHPGLDRELLTLSSMPPQMLARFGETVAHLRSCGFPTELAFLAADSVFDLALTQFVLSGVVRRAAGPDGTTGLGGGTDRAEPVPPQVAAMVEAAVVESPALWFDRKLDLILDGVQARLGPASRR
ncbi:TetR/AcrR family transcriptional regulator [Solwaraspora sp. WMMB335]|uniref:TetR/AcrR family transcriptional regulator n=1 Tax=Solwaraspora sp. WMMB335 TaxID=3404118 RepID=UPI003B92F3A9